LSSQTQGTPRSLRTDEIKANPYFANSFLGGLILLAIVLDRVREIVSAKRNSSEDSNKATVAADASRPAELSSRRD